MTTPSIWQRPSATESQRLSIKRVKALRSKDPAYLKRRTAALEAGLLWGAYHFSSGRDVGEQFDNFMAGTNWKKLADKTTLLCLDFEPSTSGPDMSLDQAHDFVTRIKNETGRWPMIYGGSLLTSVASSRSGSTDCKA